jgi:hypothetical protein
MYQVVHNNETFKKSLSSFKDDIIVYRIVSFFSFFSSMRDFTLFNPNFLQKRCILFNPIYQSTSFTSNYLYTNYLNSNGIILKIHIPKTSKKWVYMDYYSAFGIENEITIDKDTYSVVMDWSYTPIYIGSPDTDEKYIDVLTIDVLLCDNLDQAFNCHFTWRKKPQRGGDIENKENDIYCINFNSEMMTLAKEKLGSTKNVINYGNLYDIPQNELKLMKDYKNIAVIGGKYLNLFYGNQMRKEMQRSHRLETTVDLKMQRPTEHKFDFPKMQPYTHVGKMKEDKFSRMTSIPQPQYGLPTQLTMMTGGNSDYQKYIKYKKKYMKLKSDLKKNKK